MDLVKVSIEPKKLSKYTLKRACLRDFNLSEKQEPKQPKMRALKKQRTVHYLKTVAQLPSSSRRKRPSKPSTELSSSEECLVAEKGRENERKGKNGRTEP